MTEPTSIIAERAATDEEFRAALLADPRAAIADLLGMPVPDGLRIRVVEAASDEAVIVVPPQASAALSEAELAAVAGGGFVDEFTRASSAACSYSFGGGIAGAARYS